MYFIIVYKQLCVPGVGAGWKDFILFFTITFNKEEKYSSKAYLQL